MKTKITTILLSLPTVGLWAKGNGAQLDDLLSNVTLTTVTALIVGGIYATLYAYETITSNMEREIKEAQKKA